MVELANKDNKRFEWLKEKLNLQDYQLKDAYPYIRETRYEKFVTEVKKKADEQRALKMDKLKAAFEEEKKIFFKEKEKFLNEINKEFDEIKSQSVSTA